jgi:proline iminopeptidase
MKIAASKEEKSMALPGDDVIHNFKGRVTFAINIRSSPQEIFPWIKQMGCQRGGWYSYDKIDNGGKPSAREIIQEFQKVKIGDFLPARPNDPPGTGFKVSGIKDNEYLVLTTFSKFPSFEPVKSNEQPKKFWRTTWTFFLKRETHDRTRLIVRNNIGFEPWWISIISNMIARPLHFIMQKRQLINLKNRIEE